MREVRCLTKNIIAILSVVACIFILVSAIFIRPTIVNSEYTITVDKTITGSDREVLSQEFEKYKNDLKQNYAENIKQLNSKFNLLLALVGIAVTVWVGLNIYNLVDRVQIDILAKKQKDITESITGISNSISNFNSEIEVISTEIETIKNEKRDLQKSIEDIHNSIEKLGEIAEDLDRRKIGFDSYLPSGL